MERWEREFILSPSTLVVDQHTDSITFGNGSESAYQNVHREKKAMDAIRGCLTTPATLGEVFGVKKEALLVTASTFRIRDMSLKDG